MKEAERLTLGYDMLYLVRCALAGERADISKIKSELSLLYYMASFHSMSAICAYALEGAVGITEEAHRLFEEAKNSAITKTVMRDVERQSVVQFLEEREIHYMLLKGSVVEEYYPERYMRQMSDVDIWYEQNRQREIMDWFEKRGYACESSETSEHDVFKKAPIFDFEMHKCLYNEVYNELWADYYIKKIENLQTESEDKCRLTFADEDFYVYMVSHAYKHYKGDGTGLRTLADFYVMIQRFKQKLDWNYVAGELEYLGLAEFEKKITGLSKKIFGEDGETTKEEQIMLDRILLSGTHGTVENALKNRIVKFNKSEGEITVGAKIKYIWSRLFLSPAEMKEYYHARYGWMLPFCYLYRLIFIGISKIGTVIKEIRIVIRAKK